MRTLEPNRRWTDPVGSGVTLRRIVVEERPDAYGTLYAVYVENGGKRLIATELGFDEAIACAALTIGNGRSAPFLRTPEQHSAHAAWVRGIERKRIVEPWERFLPERTATSEALVRR